MNPRTKLIFNVIPIVVFGLGFLLVWKTMHASQAISNRNHITGVQNNTYLRLNACIISVPPQRRTPIYVKQCYDTVEKTNGITITRYGDAR